jgi:hypothetical protein
MKLLLLRSQCCSNSTLPAPDGIGKRDDRFSFLQV